MKVWLLLPQNNLPEDDNPWAKDYDACFGMVVRAATETAARALATRKGHAEIHVWKNTGFPTAWINAHYSTCVELTGHGVPCVLLQDTHWS